MQSEEVTVPEEVYEAVDRITSLIHTEMEVLYDKYDNDVLHIPAIVSSYSIGYLIANKLSFDPDARTVHIRNEMWNQANRYARSFQKQRAQQEQTDAPEPAE